MRDPSSENQVESALTGLVGYKKTKTTKGHEVGRETGGILGLGRGGAEGGDAGWISMHGISKKKIIENDMEGAPGIDL